MRYVLLLLLTTAIYARAQTPQELLRLAQDTYKRPEGYLIKGGLSATFRILLAGFWDGVAEYVVSVRETGSDTLPLDGAPTACRVLQVECKAPADAPKPSPVTYSICSDRYLVLKKVMFYPTGRHATDPPVPWTITFETAKFNRPVPDGFLI